MFSLLSVFPAEAWGARTCFPIVSEGILDIPKDTRRFQKQSVSKSMSALETSELLLESEPGKGTRFIILLPIGVADEPGNEQNLIATHG